MFDPTLARLEAEIQEAGISPEKKAELSHLIAELRAELNRLPDAQAEHARSIAGFVQVSTHEATRRARRRELLELSLDGLEKSVEEFEATHPRLVQAVAALSNALASVGI
jgi:hypothetical protein